MQLKYFLAASAASLSLACGLAAPVMAQETTSSISGTVTSGGAPVVGAVVQIRDTETGATSTVTSSNTGSFDASGLRPGDSYTVNVTATGYAAAQVTDIVPVVATTYALPIVLTADAGSNEPAIVVTATRLPGAGTVSQGPATVLSAAQIAMVPSTNRDIRDLARRDPFARLDDSPSGGRAISFAGQNPRYNKFSVDGVAITDNFGLNTDGLPSRRSPIPFDAIGQFQAKVAPFDTREGNFQGGSINIVLRSGTNRFQGTGFYAYSADELAGTKTKAGPGVPTGQITLPNYTYQNYGAEISGPIIKDRLFFMIAGERLRANLPIPEGPTDNNAGTAIQNLFQSDVDKITSIAKSKYGYDTGGVLKGNGDSDDRVVAKLDANLSDTQRASITYTYAKDAINLVQNAFTTPTFGLGLASNAYIQSNRLHTGSFQLNSEWSDEFSTEVRGFYKDYLRGQDPYLGRGFAQFIVCTAPQSDRFVLNGQPVPQGTPGASVNSSASANISCPSGFSNVALGPDISRQTNALTSKTYGGLVQVRYKHAGHDLRIFGDVQNTTVFNSFLQRSAGDYYFDSIADFQAGNAQRLRYQNAIPSLNPNDAAATFRYQAYVFGIQDTWRYSDILTVTYGMRYDLYGGKSRAAFNPVFDARYGFANNRFLSGLGIFQPRFGFDFHPTNTFSIRGGVGVFSGGTPDVYVSNSFSNTGVLSNAIEIQQANNGTYTGTGLPAGTGAIALTNVSGTTIPTAVNNYLLAGTVSANSPVNAIDPNFKIPSQARFTLSAEWRPENLGPLGGGWTIGGDLFYSRVRSQVFFTDLRVRQNGLLTPDGRARYTPITTFADTNSDLLLTNSNQGRSYVAVARLGKRFDFGLTGNFSFTYQDIKDRNPATSSVASSNYAAGVSLDANGPAYGIANDQVKYAFKYSLNFDHAFFGDYKTNISLFGETRIGRPFSYTFRDLSARSTVFGTIGSGSRYLLYVPTGPADPKVSYANANDAALFDQFITTSGLAKYRGMITPRNAFNSRWISKLDLHLSQELPTFVGKSRITLFGDVENFTNLLNKNWGQIREYAFPYTIAPVTVTCLTTAVATGTLPGTSAAANAGQACAQYRYAANQTEVVNGVTQFTAPTDTIYPKQSLYTIRVGVRFSF